MDRLLCAARITVPDEEFDEWAQRWRIRVFKHDAHTRSFSNVSLLMVIANLNGHFDGLTMLSLYSVHLGPPDLIVLANALQTKAFPLLTDLLLACCALYDDGLSVLLEIASTGCYAGLTTLDITNNNLTDEGILCLAEEAIEGAFQSLQILTVAMNDLTDDSIVHLLNAAVVGGFPSLVKLHHEGTQISSIGGDFVAMTATMFEIE
jgi:hypothetical protein